MAQALSNAKPGDLERRVLLVIAHYRLGHYGEALALLESWKSERLRAIVAKVGQCLMPSWPAPFFDQQPLKEGGYDALAFQAMAQFRLGQHLQARSALADLRCYPIPPNPNHFPGPHMNWGYKDLLREAEALIEGPPKK